MTHLTIRRSLFHCSVDHRLCTLHHCTLKHAFSGVIIGLGTAIKPLSLSEVVQRVFCETVKWLLTPSIGICSQSIQGCPASQINAWILQLRSVHFLPQYVFDDAFPVSMPTPPYNWVINILSCWPRYLLFLTTLWERWDFSDFDRGVIVGAQLAGASVINTA